MNKTFRQLFNEHTGRLIHKWDHYFDIYDKYFSEYRGKEINFLEIGISHGGSLQIWREYFGPNANIYAFDINEECIKFEENKTKIFIGSQDDEAFLRELKNKLPDLDILLDDGGHTMSQQLKTFKNLFKKVKDTGIYMVEDTHTSYWPAYHGGLRNKSSFIEFSKSLIDEMHAWQIEFEKTMPITDITKSVTGISFHDSIIVFEKGKREKPFDVMKGTPTITQYQDPTLKKDSIYTKVMKKINRRREGTLKGFGNYQ